MKHQQVYLISNHQPEQVKFQILTNGEIMKSVEVKIFDVRYVRKTNLQSIDKKDNRDSSQEFQQQYLQVSDNVSPPKQTVSQSSLVPTILRNRNTTPPPRAFTLTPHLQSKAKDEPTLLNNQSQLTLTQKTPQQTSIASNNLRADSIKQLQSENSQLQRRLILVQTELDRVSHEKREYQQNLGAITSSTENLIKQIDFEQTHDEQNQQLSKYVTEERDRNKITKKNISKCDDAKLQTQNALKILNDEKDIAIANFRQIKEEITTKGILIKEIESQIQFTEEQIETVIASIRSKEYQIQDQQNENNEIYMIVSNLNQERDVLQNKLQQLNDTYDTVVEEISEERASLEYHHRQHLQLISSKVLFQIIESMFASRKQAVLNELKSYAKFDTQCHDTLKIFAGILERCGRFQLQIAIKQWFQNSLKPLSIQQQSLIISDKIYESKIKYKLFKTWQQKLNGRSGHYGVKLQATQKIWFIKSKDIQIEIRRSLSIWRDYLKREQAKEKRLKIVILRQESSLKRQSIFNWLSYCMEFDSIVRQHSLANSFTYKQHTSIALNQLRQRVVFKKRVRLLKLLHLFKAWKDSNAYRQYIMGQNVSAGHLQRQIKKRLLQNCFQAIQLFKENQKYNLMIEKLNDSYQPACQDLSSNIEEQSYKTLKQKKLRCYRCIEKNILAKMFSYFKKWQKIEEIFKLKLSKNMKSILCRLLRSKLQSAFNLWMISSKQKSIEIIKSKFKQLNDQSSNLNQEVEEVELTLNDQSDRIQRRIKISLQRTTNILIQRMLKNALIKWNNRVKMLNALQYQGAQVIIKKIRFHYTNQAFKIFKDNILTLKQDLFAQSRCQHFIQTRQARMKRLSFNAFCQYIKYYVFSRKNLHVLLNNIDIWILKRAFKNWVDQNNLKANLLLKEDQNNKTFRFGELNQQLALVIKSQTEINLENEILQKSLKKQANHVLSNAFARFYYIKASRGIKRWCDYVKFQKHKEQIIFRTLQHWKKHKFNFMKAVFCNWIQNSKNSELKAQIKQIEIQSENAVQQKAFNQTQHNNYAVASVQDVKNAQCEEKLLHTKFTKVVQLIISKNDQNNYQSYLRFFVSRWRQFTVRQITFTKAIVNSLTKSMWKNGFIQLQNFSRDKEYQRVKGRVTEGMSRMMLKKYLQKSFSKWREILFTKADGDTNQIDTQINKIENVQKEFVDSSQIQTGQQGIRYFKKLNLSNHFRAWKIVSKWLKAARVQKEHHKDALLNYSTIVQLKKWRSRVLITQKCRANLKKFNLLKGKIYLIAIFNGWKQQYRYLKKFSQRLNEIAIKFDFQVKDFALKTLKNFAKSRNDYKIEQSHQSVKDLASALKLIFKNRMTNYLSELRTKIGIKKSKCLLVQSMFGHWYARGLRISFQKWKSQSQKCATAEEVNEQGPIVEDVLNWQMQYHNCKKFLQHQGYTKYQIPQIQQWAQSRQKDLLSRSIARLKHNADHTDARIIPKMFDRWKMFVKIRQLIKYLLNNMENNLTPVKSDLSVAFNRWRKYKVYYSKGKDRSELIKKCADGQKKAEYLTTIEDQAQKFKTQMNIQRDELVDNYIKSQRLGIALGRNKIDQSIHKTISRLLDHCQESKRFDFEAVLQQNLNHIQVLKEKIQEFEKDNDTVAVENEELRQFSLNGYQMARNVQQLNQERESFSVDLADKAKTIKKLLQQNENLSIQLRQVQEQSVQLQKRLRQHY